MDKKKMKLAIVLGTAAFLAVCTAQSLLALRLALEEKKEREQAAEEN